MSCDRVTRFLKNFRHNALIMEDDVHRELFGIARVIIAGEGRSISTGMTSGSGTQC